MQKTALLYKKIGALHYREKNYPLANTMYHNGLQYDSITKTAADIHYKLFLVKRKLNQQDSILFYLDNSLKLFKQFELDKSSYNAFLTAGIIYKNRQFYDKAMEYLIMAYKGYITIKDDNKLANVCTTIGNIQKRLKNYNQALDYHNQALRLQKKLNNQRGIGRCYANIANAQDDLKLVDSAVVKL